jgi:hypothetical protein
MNKARSASRRVTVAARAGRVTGLPKQGRKAPWRVYQNYVRDLLSLKWAPVDDGALEFSNPGTDRRQKTEDSRQLCLRWGRLIE